MNKKIKTAELVRTIYEARELDLDVDQILILLTEKGLSIPEATSFLSDINKAIELVRIIFKAAEAESTEEQILDLLKSKGLTLSEASIALNDFYDGTSCGINTLFEDAFDMKNAAIETYQNEQEYKSLIFLVAYEAEQSKITHMANKIRNECTD